MWHTDWRFNSTAHCDLSTSKLVDRSSARNETLGSCGKHDVENKHRFRSSSQSINNTIEQQTKYVNSSPKPSHESAAVTNRRRRACGLQYEGQHCCSSQWSPWPYRGSEVQEKGTMMEDRICGPSPQQSSARTAVQRRACSIPATANCLCRSEKGRVRQVAVT